MTKDNCECKVDETTCKYQHDTKDCKKCVKRIHTDYVHTTHVQPVKYFTYQKHNVTKIYEPEVYEECYEPTEKCVYVCDDEDNFNCYCDCPDDVKSELKKNKEKCSKKHKKSKHCSDDEFNPSCLTSSEQESEPGSASESEPGSASASESEPESEPEPCDTKKRPKHCKKWKKCKKGKKGKKCKKGKGKYTLPGYGKSCVCKKLGFFIAGNY